MVNTILAKRGNHIVAKGGNPACPKGSKSRGFSILRIKGELICLIKNAIMGIKPGPKRIAKSTGMPDRRQRDNKQTPGNTPFLKPHIHKKGD